MFICGTINPRGRVIRVDIALGSAVGTTPVCDPAAASRGASPPPSAMFACVPPSCLRKPHRADVDGRRRSAPSPPSPLSRSVKYRPLALSFETHASTGVAAQSAVAPRSVAASVVCGRSVSNAFSSSFCCRRGIVGGKT